MARKCGGRDREMAIQSISISISKSAEGSQPPIGKRPPTILPTASPIAQSQTPEALQSVISFGNFGKIDLKQR